MNDDAHLDDEALSAALDGELDGVLAGELADAARVHLAACNRCSARQAELHAVALALGGEPVAEFAQIFKAEFAGPIVWIAGYSNDMFGYLPTRRVQRAGDRLGSRTRNFSSRRKSD